MQEVKLWQNRPLEELYPIVYVSWKMRKPVAADLQHRRGAPLFQRSYASGRPRQIAEDLTCRDDILNLKAGAIRVDLANASRTEPMPSSSRSCVMFSEEIDDIEHLQNYNLGEVS